MFCLQTQTTVYEIVSDMSSRYDSFEERILGLEDKLSTIQEQVTAEIFINKILNDLFPYASQNTES